MKDLFRRHLPCHLIPFKAVLSSCVQLQDIRVQLDETQPTVLPHLRQSCPVRRNPAYHPTPFKTHVHVRQGRQACRLRGWEGLDRERAVVKRRSTQATWLCRRGRGYAMVMPRPVLHRSSTQATCHHTCTSQSSINTLPHMGYPTLSCRVAHTRFRGRVRPGAASLQLGLELGLGCGCGLVSSIACDTVIG